MSTKYYSSNRIASIMGNGLLTFIDIKVKMNHFFSNKEIIFYNNINDLSEKIEKISENEPTFWPSILRTVSLTCISNFSS